MIRFFLFILSFLSFINFSYADSWQTFGTATNLNVSTTSSSSQLGWVAAGTSVPPIAYVCNTGTNDIYVSFGGSNLIVDYNNPPLPGSTTGTLITVNGCKTFTLNSTSQYVGAVTKTGTSSIYVVTGAGNMVPFMKPASNASSSITVSVNSTSIVGGQPIQISWSTVNAPSANAAVQLLLVDASTNFAVERISDMTGSALSGTMTWTVPTQLTGNYKVAATLYNRSDDICTIPDAASSVFHVSGNQLLTQSDTAFGPLVGVIDITPINHLAALEADMRTYGFNEVRVATSPGVGLNSSTLLNSLDQVISAITSQGNVVLLDNNSGSYEENVWWLAFLANRYKSNPLVWLTPKNETDCDTSRDRQLPTLDNSYCDNLAHWQTTNAGYVSAIRGTGFANPIVIQMPGYFAINLAEVLSPNILPVDSNLILAVHPYPVGTNVLGCCQSVVDSDFTATASSTLEDNWWANFSNTYPIFIDEAGTWYTTQTWESGFLPFAKNWIQNDNGLGIAAFFWRGNVQADPNSQMMLDAGTLTTWGTNVNTNIFTTLGAVSHPVGAITQPPPIGCTFPDSNTTIASSNSANIAITTPVISVPPRCTIYAYSGTTITGNQLTVAHSTSFNLGYTNVGHPTSATLTINGVDSGLSITLPNAKISVTAPSSPGTYNYQLNPSNTAGSSSCIATVSVT